MQLPSAIIFVNADLTAVSTEILMTQLFIHEKITGEEFDARVEADPNYPTIIHGNNLRLLVVRDDFMDFTNRELADVVIFIKQGQAVVEKNNFGPPSLSLPIYQLYLHQLLRFNEKIT
jgi:hypothetical protein